jgi:hypothetical protein
MLYLQLLQLTTTDLFTPVTTTGYSNCFVASCEELETSLTSQPIRRKAAAFKVVGSKGCIVIREAIKTPQLTVSLCLFHIFYAHFYKHHYHSLLTRKP